MLVLTLLSCFVSQSATFDADVKLLEAVQENYAQAGDIQAGFTQTFIHGTFKRQRQESGMLWTKADGRVRWEYHQPEPKLFIYDGKNAYFYEPRAAQVTVFDNFNDTPLYDALRFLLARDEYGEKFSVKPCAAHCPPIKSNEVLLALWPKERLGDIDHVLLVIDKTTKQVRKSVVIDSQKNRTEYQFNHVEFGAHFTKEFTYSQKPGVEELRWSQAQKPKDKKPTAKSPGITVKP